MLSADLLPMRSSGKRRQEISFTCQEHKRHRTPSSSLRPAFLLLQKQLSHAIELAPFGDAPASNVFPYSVSQVVAWVKRRLECDTVCGSREPTVSEVVVVSNTTLLHLYRVNLERLRSEIAAAQHHLDELVDSGFTLSVPDKNIAPSSLLDLVQRHGPWSLRRQLDELPEPSVLTRNGSGLLDATALLTPLQRLTRRLEGCKAIFFRAHACANSFELTVYSAAQVENCRTHAGPDSSLLRFISIRRVLRLVDILGWLAPRDATRVCAPTSQLKWKNKTSWKCSSLEAEVCISRLRDDSHQGFASADDVERVPVASHAPLLTGPTRRQDSSAIPQQLLVQVRLKNVSNEAQKVSRLTISDVDAARELDLLGCASMAARDVYFEPPIVLGSAGSYLAYFLKLPLPYAARSRPNEDDSAVLPTYTVVEVSTLTS